MLRKILPRTKKAQNIKYYPPSPLSTRPDTKNVEDSFSLNDNDGTALSWNFISILLLFLLVDLSPQLQVLIPYNKFPHYVFPYLDLRV